MSDIPVGSPPAPPGRHAAPGGWYPDPVDPAQERYWDGWQWSRTTRLRELGPTPAATGPRTGPYGPAHSVHPYAGVPLRPGVVAPTTADGVPLAGWGRRALAACLDAVITYLVVSLLTSPFYGRLSQALSDYFIAVVAASRSGASPPPPPVTSEYISTSQQLAAAAIIFAFWLIYNAGFLRWKSATPGKLAFGLRVVPVDRGHAAGRLSWQTALLRTTLWLLPRLAGYLPSTVVLFFVLRLADVLLPLRHPKRQSIHDLLAKTQVVKPR